MNLARLVSRLVEVRAGEGRLVVAAFATLGLASAGYTVLETVRDTLLVTRVGGAGFAMAYLATAAFTLPVAALLQRATRRSRPRRAFATTCIAVSAAAALGLLTPWSPVTVIASYASIGVAATAVFPRFWLLAGAALTLGQARRLLGPIAAASIVGNVLGSMIAAALLDAASLRALFPVAAAFFAAAAAAASLMPASSLTEMTVTSRSGGWRQVRDVLRAEPLVARIAILVVLTTVTALITDYFFKWTIARTIPDSTRGAFLARVYAVINLAALVLQIAVSGTLVRRIGAVGAMAVTPLFALGAALTTIMTGGALVPVLLLKGLDGTLRASVHRLAMELVYLPVSAEARQRAKPFIDGSLLRLAQALAAGPLIWLPAAHLLSPDRLAAIVAISSGAWLAAALAMRRPYVAQLHCALAGVGSLPRVEPMPIDIATAELIVEHLGSDDPLVALAAMTALERRGHVRLLPALILEHDDPRVLSRGLAILERTERTDWLTRAGHSLAHPAERVRIAAARALASRGLLDPCKLVDDAAPVVRGYAMAYARLRSTGHAPCDPALAQVLANAGDEAGRLGVVAALADVPCSRVAGDVLVAVAEGSSSVDGAFAELFARAAKQQRDARAIPMLIALLRRRAARESVRAALMAMSEPAAAAIAERLADPTTDLALRAHLPQSLARFGTRWAADRLLDCIESDPDGRVRFKAIVALARLATETEVSLDRNRVERCALAQLETHFQRLAMRVVLGTPPDDARARNTHELLVGFLDDKLRQAIERAFRLLKAAHPREDIYRMYAAIISSDARARGHAGEVLDRLLDRRDQRSLREAIRIVSDDLPAHGQVERAEAALGIVAARSDAEALRAALADPDPKLAAIAAMHVEALTPGPRAARTWMGEVAHV